MNRCTCLCKVSHEFPFYCEHMTTFWIFRCEDAIKKEPACLPLFKVFPLFPPPSSLSLLLSVPIKGQWISLPYFQVTSSVFDFYAYLKLAMGLTLSPLISPARNWTCLSCLSDDGPLMGGIHLAGACLDGPHQGMMAAGHKEKRGPELCNSRRWRKDDYRCGSREFEPCLS